MRFSIKAKLAIAFGAVTILSVIVGGVAYRELTSLDTSQQAIVGQGVRLKKTAALMDQIQFQQRDEMRMITAATDKDTADSTRDMILRQENTIKLKDELYGLASEQGKRMLETASAKLKRFDELQLQSSKLAALNSNNRAVEMWHAVGLPALAQFNAALETAMAELKKSPTADHLQGILALQSPKFEAARLSRLLATTFAVSRIEDLEPAIKAVNGQLAVMKASAAQAATQVAPLGIAVDAINAQVERVGSATAQIAAIVAESGNIKALALTGGEGRAAFNEALNAFEAYGKFANDRMSELAAAGTEEAAFAKMLLISIIIGSVLIAIASATWIALNISRGLNRAVGLADAVATGDLTRTLTVTGDDEVADMVRSLNNTVERLRAVVADTMMASQNMSAGSQELSASAEQLSQGATEQASASEEASSSMEQMAANVKQNAENASQTEK
ncbi:HAMP domain-containing methyl-accepting chemotaxis protein, partial [Rhodopseudomonas palustris]